MLGSLLSSLLGSSLLRLLLHLLLLQKLASALRLAKGSELTAQPQSLISAPAALQDHPILVERTTRLQQPLQYEREYVAETRLTGETPVA